MADIQQTATVEVQVNGEQAKNELQSLEKYASSLKDRIADAYNAGDTKKMKELEKELKKTNSQLRTMRTNAVNIDEVMQNLSTTGPKELQKTLKAINKELESGRIKRGSQEWNEYQAKLKLVNAEIRKIKSEGVEAESFLSRMNGKLSKWGGMIASAAVAITGLSMAFSKMRKDSMDKEESQDNLKALTGLDDGSITWLTQQAEVLSTTMDASGLRVKQSSQEILDAYTLVGSAKPELLSNKEALNAVTVETMRLSTAAKMDLKEAVDAVTLSMNQYGASADEAAKYTNVMAAGSKYGSVAVQSITAAVIKAGVSASGADVSIEQLVGSIETLGEKGIKDEVAGTGLKTFFLRLQTGADDTNPKVVGLQTALKNLQKLSTQDILTRFGQEAYTVAQTLIAGADKVGYYTKAVTGTNVATEQAAINSDNAAAKMAQMKNQLKEAGIELMQKLNPSVNLLGSYFTNLIKIMPPLIDFLQKYGGVIVYGTIVVLSYMAAVKLQHFWLTKVKTATGEYIVIQKLKQFWDKAVAASTWLYIAATSALTGKTNQAKLAMKAFFLITKANPFAFIATLIVAVAGALYLMTRRLSEAQRAQKLLNDVQGEASSQISAEKQEVESLLKIAKDETLSKEERLKAIKRLNKISPEYLGNLSLEKINTDEAKKSVDNYIQSILLLAEAESAKRRLTDTDTELDELKKKQAKYLKERGTFAGAVKALPKNVASLFTAGIAEGTGESLTNSIKELEQRRNQLKKIIEDKTRKSIENEVSNSDGGDGGSGGSGSGGSLDNDAKKKRIQELESETAQFKAHTTSLYAIGKITKQEYDDSIIQSDKDLLEKKMALYDEKSKEYSDFLIQLKQMDIKNQEQCNKETLDEIEAGIKAEQRTLLDQYMDQTLDKKTYDEGIIRLDRESLVRKRNLYASGTKEFKDYQKQLEDFDAQDRERRHKVYEDKLAEFRKEYQEKSLKELKEKELADLKAVYNSKLILKEEYEKMILAIEQKYAGLGVEEPNIQQKVSQKTTDNLNVAKAKAREQVTPEDKSRVENGSLFFTLFGAESKDRENTLTALQDMEKEGVISHQEAIQAKAMLDAEYFAGMADKMQAAYAVMNTIVSAYSEYSQASQDLEEAKINKKYDAEIKAAGNSTAKKKQIEERKEKELAKVKSKYADRAFKIQIAQGLAQTAIGAISAYASAAAVPVVGYILGPIAAAAAVAAGMLNMATIYKQHEASKQGYASGGFTPSGRWDEEKGAVHSGEFVANRFAVRNKQILPVLRLIDNAQKSNTIGSLTAQDVTSVLSGGQVMTSATTGAEAGSGADNSAESLTVMLEYTYTVIDKLNKRLNEPFQTVNAVDGPDGIKQAMDKYDSLQRNKSRV